jgi:histidinol-phosphate aminotransferase
MTYLYEKVITPTSGLRLHLNENTGGCSPAVIDALRGITAETVALYPDYTEAIAAAARRLAVPEAELLLTNGLDEGILAACISSISASRRESPEAIVVVPAFDMQASCAEAAGARIVEVPLRDGFAFPTEEVIAAVTPATRIIFITTPNNPTGISAPRDGILRIAAAAPAAVVFVDEAYADFSGSSLIGDPALANGSNIIVGRTFAKAYGLAALRCGALVGAPQRLEAIRRVLPPYNINVATAVALPAALRDRAYYEWYLEQVRESKRLLYAAFERLAVPYWQSDANFVLVRFGDRAAEVCSRLAARGIYVRDRSKTRGCTGCVRITAGIVEHTRRCANALEEVLCAVR